MQGSIGTLWGLFKNWPAHYMWNMAQYSKVAMQTGDVAPLLWAMAGTGLVGGLTAVPGYFLFDKFSQFVSNKDATTAVYEGMGAEGDSPVLDSVFYGVPNFFGVSLSSRAAAPFSDPSRDMNSLFSIATIDRGKALFEFVGKATDTFLGTGQGPGQSRAVFDAFSRAVAPRTVNRFLQTTADGAMRSLGTSNQLMSDLNLVQRLAYIIGVAPTEVQKSFDLQQELWKNQTQRKEMVGVLGEEASEAMEQKDIRGYANLVKRGWRMGIDPASIHSSATANYHNRNEDLLERQFQSYLDMKAKKAVLGRY
jgi:hypothetical protein